MDLATEVNCLWNGDHERQVAGWLNDIEQNIARTRSARKSFHQWHPLRVYVNASELMNSGAASFSLRFKGQEVSKLIVSREGLVEIKLDTKHEVLNKRHFGFTSVKAGRYGWKSPAGQCLRDYFKKNVQNSDLRPRQPEHEVETNIIREMSKKKRETKFGGKFHGVQPVMVEGCPLQMPLPISGSSGSAKLTKGNIDILARRVGTKGRVRLSVWELKKPAVTSTVIEKAIRQAAIYSLILTKVLRSESGPGWYRLFGFSRKLPARFQVESVVTLSNDDRQKFEKAWSRCRDSFPQKIGNDEILPYVAFYDKAAYAIDAFESLI